MEKFAKDVLSDLNEDNWFESIGQLAEYQLKKGNQFTHDVLSWVVKNRRIPQKCSPFLYGDSEPSWTWWNGYGKSCGGIIDTSNKLPTKQELVDESNSPFFNLKKSVGVLLSLVDFDFSCSPRHRNYFGCMFEELNTIYKKMYDGAKFKINHDGFLNVEQFEKYIDQFVEYTSFEEAAGEKFLPRNNPDWWLDLYNDHWFWQPDGLPCSLTKSIAAFNEIADECGLDYIEKPHDNFYWSGLMSDFRFEKRLPNGNLPGVKRWIADQFLPKFLKCIKNCDIRMLDDGGNLHCDPQIFNEKQSKSFDVLNKLIGFITKHLCSIEIFWNDLHNRQIISLSRVPSLMRSISVKVSKFHN